MRVRKSAGVLVAVALLVAGCTSPVPAPPDGDLVDTSVEDAASEPAPETDAEEEPEPEPEPEFIEASAGDILTEDEAELLPEGQAGYPLEDGTFVVVNRDEELPEVLVQELFSLIPDEVPTEYRGRQPGDFPSMANRIALLTGRQLIIVARGGDYDERGRLERVAWSTVATGEAREILIANVEAWSRNRGSQQVAVEFAEWLLGQVEDPDSYQILIHDAD